MIVNLCCGRGHAKVYDYVALGSSELKGSSCFQVLSVNEIRKHGRAKSAKASSTRLTDD